MKNNDNAVPLVPKLNSTFDNTFEGLKVGMGVTHDLMSRYPAYKPIALVNDAFFNISVSSIAQRKSFGKAVAEWSGGIAAGSVCAIGSVGWSALVLGGYCGYKGGEISGKLYDTIARANGYRDASDYISAVEYFRRNPGPSFNESLAYQKALTGLTEGDFTYVNSPYSGLQLFTKENGKILKVAVLPPGIDHSHVRHPNSIQSHSSVSNTSTAIDISIPITSNVSNQGAVVPYVSSSSSDHSVNSRALIVKPPVFPEVPMQNIVIPSDLEIASSPYVLSRTCNTLGNLAMQHQRAQALSEFIATYENEPWQEKVTKERVFGIKAFTIKKVSHTKPHAGQVEQAKIELADANQAITSLQQSMITETQIAIAEAKQKLIESAELAIIRAIENRESSLVAEYHNILNKVRLDSEGNNAIHIAIINASKTDLYSSDLLPGQDVYFLGNLTINGDITLGNITFGARSDGYTDNARKTLNLINHMIEKNIDFNAQNHHGMTPFMLSCAHGHIYLTKQLLMQSNLVDHTKRDNSGFDNFLWALELKDKEILEKLLQIGSNIDVQDNMGRTPLYWMCLYNNPELIKFLLTKGANPLVADNEGVYPVHISASKDHVESLQTLSDHSSDILDITTDNENRITPLWIASQDGKTATVQYLIEQNVDSNRQRLDTGLTPLHTAISKNHLEIVKQLLPVSDVTIQDNNANNALMYSLQLGNVEIIIAIIEKNADTNHVNKAGMTPLLFAVLNSNTPLVDLLITHGANPNLAVGNIPPINGNDFSGWYVLKIFISASNIELTERISIFEKHMTKFTYEVLDDCGFDVQPPVIDTSAHDTELIGQEGLHDLM